ncbi:MAG: MtrB/PioB family decaheme-associated outer membrane protein [Gammaproteobacteria bacterium]|jgi:MtrB/PioB family decaheme-associated outer membrane protein
MKINLQRKLEQLVVFCGIVAVMPAVMGESLTDAQLNQVTAGWECKWCPYEEAPVSRGEVEAGIGYVTNDSFKHGDYTGLDEKGGYLIAGGEYAYRGNGGAYSNVEADDLGLDSRRISAEGGRQGNIEGALIYSELPKLNLDTARTPYNVGVNQTLPAGWVTAGNTSGMTELANALHPVDISTQRDTLDLSANYYQTKSLSYGLNFQRTTKEGYRQMALAIGGFAGSAVLAVPVDYVTDQGTARVSYKRPRWQANLSYQFSNFDNDADSIRWDNAFTSGSGATEGRAALEPDNTMQQFSLSGNYRVTSSTRASALLSIGRMEQDDSFLPYTVNGTLGASPLPRNSLDGKVNTFAGNITLNTNVAENLELQARYKQNEQENDTPRATYDYVNTDSTISGTARTNVPYGFRQRELSVEGGYQLQRPHKINAGYVYEKFDRTFQEVDATEEDTLWGSYRNQFSEKLEWFVRLEARDRSGDQYEVITAPGFPAEDPLLRKYNMADRDRTQASFSVSYMPQQAIQLNLFADYANDDYSNSEVGLTDSEQTNYGVEVQYQFSEEIALNADFTITNMDSRQAGTNWTANNDDQVNVAHIGVIYVIMRDKMKIGADYSYADSEGDISVNPGTPYPTLTSTRHTFKLYGDYQLNERSVLHVSFHYEDYEEKNWAVDDVAPNTVGSVLTMGEISPDYSIGVLGVSLRYTLD